MTARDSTQVNKALPSGIYVPIVSIFKESDTLDLNAIALHIENLVEAGVSGIVIHGSNGEAVHLSDTERVTSLLRARQAMYGLERGKNMPLIAGCSAASTPGTIRHCQQAAEAGATHALVLPPGYYSSLITDDMIVAYYHELAAKSPIPILIYNFPKAAFGIDLSSDTILRIAQHPNICGVKLTCGNLGKLARIAADAPQSFFIAGGSADHILQGHVVGAHASIAGLANIAPRACVHIIELANKGDYAAARKMQATVAKADGVAINAGFIGVKAGLKKFHKFSGAVRHPFVEPTGAEAEKLYAGFQEVMDLENSLSR